MCFLIYYMIVLPKCRLFYSKVDKNAKWLFLFLTQLWVWIYMHNIIFTMESLFILHGIQYTSIHVLNGALIPWRLSPRPQFVERTPLSLSVGIHISATFHSCASRALLKPGTHIKCTIWDEAYFEHDICHLVLQNITVVEVDSHETVMHCHFRGVLSSVCVLLQTRGRPRQKARYLQWDTPDEGSGETHVYGKCACVCWPMCQIPDSMSSVPWCV